MNFFCKLVYKDKIEPTEYFKDKKFEEVKEEIYKIIEGFLMEEDITGIYIGKK